MQSLENLISEVKFSSQMPCRLHGKFITEIICNKSASFNQYCIWLWSFNGNYSAVMILNETSLCLFEGRLVVQ